MRFIVFLFIVVMFNSCIKKQSVLNFELLDSLWSSNLKDSIKGLDESGAIIYLFAEKTNYINSWFIDNNNVNFINYLASKGVTDEYDIIIISIQAYHRHLLNKKIDLDGLINNRIKELELLDNCQRKKLRNSINYYKKYSVGDELTVKIPFDKTQQGLTLYQIACLEEDKRLSQLFVGGVLIEKNKFMDRYSLFFKIKVDTVSPKNKYYKVGEIGYFDLDGLLVKPRSR